MVQAYDYRPELSNNNNNKVNSYNDAQLNFLKKHVFDIPIVSVGNITVGGTGKTPMIIYLSQLRQIGKWSAEMILLFTYNRPNIWPIQDIGLLRGISKNYKKKYLPPESYVKLLNKRFSPYCSVATWYLWRSIDPEPIQY